MTPSTGQAVTVADMPVSCAASSVSQPQAQRRSSVNTGPVEEGRMCDEVSIDDKDSP